MIVRSRRLSNLLLLTLTLASTSAPQSPKKISVCPMGIGMGMELGMGMGMRMGHKLKTPESRNGADQFYWLDNGPVSRFIFFP